MTRRVFLAINLPDEIKKNLDLIISELKNLNPNHGVKWIAPENLHLTLHFFGDLNEKQIALVEEGIEEITKNIKSFEMTTGEFGCFPDEQSPRVFFTALQDGPEIHELVGQLKVMLQNLGYKTDTRPFRAHLTLGRIKDWSRCKVTNIEIPSMTFVVKSIELMESQLTPEGSTYSTLKSFPLK